MSNPHSWIVREAVPEDEEALGALFQTVFGFRRSATHDQWKFASNPAGPPVTAVADDGGRIVGQYALWPTFLRFGSEVVRGAQSLDTMTHPDYRGQGMFSVLAEACMTRYAVARGIEVLYGFPNENSRPGFVRRLDWDETGGVPLWVRPLAIERHSRVPAGTRRLAGLTARLLPRGSSRGLDIRREAPTSDALEALLKVWREQPGRCRVERSPAYFAWRFSAASAMGYRWIVAYRHGIACAFAVWGTDLRSGNAVLGELLGDDAGVGAVLSTAVEDALAAGCPLMLAVSNVQARVSALRRTGFFRRGALPLIVRKLTTRSFNANPHTHANWEVFGADLDTF